jgi:hypothetical protein
MAKWRDIVFCITTDYLLALKLVKLAWIREIQSPTSQPNYQKTQLSLRTTAFDTFFPTIHVLPIEDPAMRSHRTGTGEFSG